MNTELTRVFLATDGGTLDFDKAKQLALDHSSKENEYTMVISWWDREKGKHSPQCLK